jgi:adhesin/invasin
MEIPTKFRSVSAGFRYWLLAFVFLASTTMLISCGGDETTITITGGGSGGADTLEISAPSSVDTGGTADIFVFATAAGEAVDGETITFQINPNQSASNLSALSATTVNGVASVTYTAGSFNIPASDTIIITGTNDLYTLPDGSCTTDSSNLPNVPGCTFAIGVLTPGLDSVAVTATPDTLEAIVGGTNNQAIIEALVTAAGTPLEGVSVDFTTTAGSICVIGAALCTGQEVLGVQTGADGIARITLQSSTIPETATVTAQAGFIRGSADVTFIPGPAATFTLNASPQSITADGQSESIVTTQVRDEAGHIVADGAVVNFSVDTTNSGGTGEFLQFPASDETVGGLASQVFTAGEIPGGIEIQVSSGGVVYSSVDDNTPGVPLINLTTENVGSISVVVEPNSLIANGAADNTVVVRATLTNSSGFPMNAGTEVTISTSGGLLDFVSPIGSDGTAGLTSLIATTDNLGVASVFLQSSTTAGTYSVNATSGGRVGIAQVDFVAGPADAAQSQLTVAPVTIPADGITTATMTLTAKDANGNPVPDGTPVAFTTSHGTISNQTTTSGGIATATITSSQTETAPDGVDLTATIDGQVLTATMTFEATVSGDPVNILLNLTGTSLTVESPGGTNAIDIEATVNDTNGPIGVDCADNITFQITLGPADAKLDGIPGNAIIQKTTVNGVAGVTLTAGQTPGTVRVEVTANQNSSDCSPGTDVKAITTAITIASGPAASLFIFPDSEVIDNNDSSTSMIMNAVVTDAFGNPVEDGTAVFFSFAVAPGSGEESVCPEVFTGGIPESACVGTTISQKGVARSKLTWPPVSIFTPYSITAETLGGTVDFTYSSNYPAAAPVTVAVDVVPGSVASPISTGTFDQNVASVVVTYEDGSTNGGPNPISNRTFVFFADNAQVSVDPTAVPTNEFGQVATTIDVACLEENTTVTITAADEFASHYFGEATFTVNGVGLGNCVP